MIKHPAPAQPCLRWIPLIWRPALRFESQLIIYWLSYESWFWLWYNPATEIIINHDEPDLEDLEQVCAVSGQSITITYATWDTMVRIMKNLRLWGRWSLFEYQHIMYKQCYKQESRTSASTLCFQSLACHCHQTGARSCARQVRG